MHFATRLRRPGGAWIAPLLLTIGALVLGVVLARYALRVWVHTADEDIYRDTALWTREHFPSGIWHLDAGISNRGYQRLEGWVMALGLWTFGSPAAFKAIKIINIICFLSTMVPVWLWCRRVGVDRALAAVAAAAAVLVPWAVLTTTYLTENVAYPAATWALFAIWSAAVRPRAATVALAAAAVLLAMLGRTVMVLLWAVFAVALAAVAMRHDAGPAWASRHHWTVRAIAPWALFGLLLLGAGAIVAFDRSALEPVTGVYTNGAALDPGAVPRQAERVLANVISGTGILPGVVALAWTGRTLWRPASREGFALAVMVVGVAALVVVSTMRAGPDERYIIYLAPVLLVAAAAAVGRREVGPVAIGVATAFVVWLFSSVHWTTDSHAYGFLINSAEAFHGRILLLGIGSRLPNVGLDYAVLRDVGIVVTMAAVIWAMRARGRPARLAGGLLLSGLLILQLAQALYVTKHFSVESAFGGPSLASHSWVDQAAAREDHVALFVGRSGPEAGVLEAWRETSFWNLKLDLILLGPGARGLDPHTNRMVSVGVDRETGLLISPVPVPRMVVELTLVPTTPLDAEPVASSGHEPMTLTRLNGPARLRWLIEGTDDQSRTVPGREATIRVFRAAGRGGCLAIGVTAPPGLSTPRTVDIRSNGRRRSVRVAPAQSVLVEGVHLRAASAGRFADVSVHPHGSTLVDGQRVGVRIGGVARTDCSAGA